MSAFLSGVLSFDPLPLDVAVQLSVIAEGRGQAEVFHLQSPRRLEALGKLAIVESVAASNAVDGITAPAVRIAALAGRRTKPRNHAEQEIAGYRYALGQIREHRAEIPPEPRDVEQIHSWLARYSGALHAGHFRAAGSSVVERADETTAEQSVPVDAGSTSAAMDELHQAFAAAAGENRIPYLLLCAVYLLEFMMIRPFTDGNGRTARLLTLRLLYGGGFDVGGYVSIERIIEGTWVDCNQALAASAAGWHASRHDPLPWTRYFLRVLVTAYRELHEQTLSGGSRVLGTREAVRRFVLDSRRDDFTAADVHEAAPEVSRDYLGVVLRGLRDEGLIELVGGGRGARWRRIGDRPR
jgi:Fic family protein